MLASMISIDQQTMTVVLDKKKGKLSKLRVEQRLVFVLKSKQKQRSNPLKRPSLYSLLREREDKFKLEGENVLGVNKSGRRVVAAKIIHSD